MEPKVGDLSEMSLPGAKEDTRDLDRGLSDGQLDASAGNARNRNSDRRRGFDLHRSNESPLLFVRAFLDSKLALVLETSKNPFLALRAREHEPQLLRVQFEHLRGLEDMRLETGALEEFERFED